jgi:hypothetical protein
MKVTWDARLVGFGAVGCGFDGCMIGILDFRRFVDRVFAWKAQCKKPTGGQPVTFSFRAVFLVAGQDLTCGYQIIDLNQNAFNRLAIS